MYETFFGLKRKPFSFTPDVESYFSVDFMEESRQAVERTVRKGEGIALIFGATGTGKSLLMRVLRQSLEPEWTVILVSNSRLETPKSLFLQLAHDLSLSCSSSEMVELRLQVLDFFRRELCGRELCRGVVLLFDEAQHLSPSVLEEIRLLTDSADGSSLLVRAVFAGTPDFEERLTFPQLEAFNQRVVSRCYLDSFTGEETSRYVVRQTDDLRIDPPHGVSAPLFTESAKRRIYQLTDGVPRLINQLCDTALQFAAEKKRDSVDEMQVNGAWASLQQIEPVETEEIHASAALESVLPPEQIEEILDQKRKTFRIRQFDPVEFGTLADSDPEPESVLAPRSFSGSDYKPPYPEDDEDFAELDAEAEDDIIPPCIVPPCIVSPCKGLQLYIPVEIKEPEPETLDGVTPDGATPDGASPNIEAVVIPKRNFVPEFYKQERKFRRQCLLEKIQHRLGLLAGLLQTEKSQQLPLPINESDMDIQSLQAYGAAVLDGRPPFIRKEPHYAYQTPETPPNQNVTYPDPKTGVPITLRWLPEQVGESERFGVSYTEFLNRKKNPEAEEQTVLSKSASFGSTSTPIVRTALNASLSDHPVPTHCSGLEEPFEESQQVSDLAISLAELFRAKSSELQKMVRAQAAGSLTAGALTATPQAIVPVPQVAVPQIEWLPEFGNLNETIQHQLEAVVQRIITAAEKIEQAAEMSEQAGRHVSKTAEFVESEVKAALPTYTDLFQQWSEFQELISTELASLRQQTPNMPAFRCFPRRQVIIERTVPSIDVESLLR